MVKQEKKREKQIVQDGKNQIQFPIIILTINGLNFPSPKVKTASKKQEPEQERQKD